MNDPDLAAVEKPADDGESIGKLAGGPGLSSEHAERVLDFVEHGRGGKEVLDRIQGELRNNAKVQDGIAHLYILIDLLPAAGVPDNYWKIDLGLARGLDYYTGVVMETTVNGWERYGSICSGGRYDDLAGLFTTRRLPGVGASIGLDRLLALLGEAGVLSDSSATAPILVVCFQGMDWKLLIEVAARLRKVGLGVETFPEPSGLGYQLGYGSTRGHRLAVIIGPDEAKNGVFNLRDLTNRQEAKGHALADLESIVTDKYKQLA